MNGPATFDGHAVEINDRLAYLYTWGTRFRVAFGCVEKIDGSRLYLRRQRGDGEWCQDLDQRSAGSCVHSPEALEDLTRAQGMHATAAGYVLARLAPRRAHRGDPRQLAFTFGESDEPGEA